MAKEQLSSTDRNPQGQIRCRVCNICKPSTEFYTYFIRVCGTIGECRECTKARVRRRARTNPKVQEYDRKRAKRPATAARIAKTAADWNEKNPLAYKAHNAVSNAVRDGRLFKEPCLFCGAEKVHAHHKDYTKPLDVVWLCPKCHHRLHAVFPETEAEGKGL